MVHSVPTWCSSVVHMQYNTKRHIMQLHMRHMRHMQHIQCSYCIAVQYQATQQHFTQVAWHLVSWLVAQIVSQLDIYS